MLFAFLFACVLGFIGLCVYVAGNQNEVRESLNEVIKDEPYTKIFRNTGTKTAMLYDDERKNIVLINDKLKDKIHYKDILQVEITEDSESVTKTKRGSQVAGATIGGLAFGGVGAIIGGLSGQQEHKEKVRQIGLRFVVNDTHNPVREIILHNFGVLRDKNHEEYQSAYKKSFKWFKLIEVLIHQADQDDKNQDLTAE